MTPSPEQALVRDYKEIRAEYAFDPSIFNGEEGRVRLLKEIISTRLGSVDRTIILLYADCLSYRKLGARMRLSHMTVRKEVLRIKREILEIYKTMTK